MTDAELIARIRAGDGLACERLVERYAGRMAATARRLLGAADADDAVQEAFLAAFRGLDSFAGQSGVGTWLHRILINACLMRLRARARRPLVPLAGEPPAGGGDSPARRETCRLVRACVERLPEPHRTVLWLRDIEEHDTGETARRLGITAGAVKTRLHRARQALRPLLEALAL